MEADAEQSEGQNAQSQEFLMAHNARFKLLDRVLRGGLVKTFELRWDEEHTLRRFEVDKGGLLAIIPPSPQSKATLGTERKTAPDKDEGKQMVTRSWQQATGLVQDIVPPAIIAAASKVVGEKNTVYDPDSAETFVMGSIFLRLEVGGQWLLWQANRLTETAEQAGVELSTQQSTELALVSFSAHELTHVLVRAANSQGRDINKRAREVLKTPAPFSSLDNQHQQRIAEERLATSIEFYALRQRVAQLLGEKKARKLMERLLENRVSALANYKLIYKAARELGFDPNDLPKIVDEVGMILDGEGVEGDEILPNDLWAGVGYHCPQHSMDQIKAIFSLS
ncbi:MAG: hypothetical protein JW991_00285 [Candidatus Pacebacteria bacterium]|nr:hypothetical protein [Candidatus Paceibacterota bacterium]